MNTGQVVDHSARLPSDVLRLAERLGSTPDSSGRLVRLTQAGSMRDDPERRFMSFTAKQTIATDRTEFAWRARTGPLGFITVVNEFENDAPRLDVRVLGWLRLASVRGEAAAAKGEIMRYLAELPWAPDAILANRHLVWRVVDGQTLRVSCRSGSVRGEVELKLNGQGCVGEVFAPDRPRKEGALFVERPWRGRFFDYREHLGRWLPFRGEVGWDVDGQTFVAWRGELMSWDCVSAPGEGFA